MINLKFIIVTLFLSASLQANAQYGCFTPEIEELTDRAVADVGVLVAEKCDVEKPHSVSAIFGQQSRMGGLATQNLNGYLICCSSKTDSK